MVNIQAQKATKLSLFNFKNISIRTFWITVIPSLTSFTWFGIVPFMPDLEKDLSLAPDQKWNSIILAVSGIFFACRTYAINRVPKCVSYRIPKGNFYQFDDFKRLFYGIINNGRPSLF